MNKPRFVRSSVIGKLTNKHTIHLLCTGLTIIWWWVEPGIVCNLKLKHMHTLSRARDETGLPPASPELLNSPSGFPYSALVLGSSSSSCSRTLPAMQYLSLTFRKTLIPHSLMVPHELGKYLQAQAAWFTRTFATTAFSRGSQPCTWRLEVSIVVTHSCEGGCCDGFA